MLRWNQYVVCFCVILAGCAPSMPDDAADAVARDDAAATSNDAGLTDGASPDAAVAADDAETQPTYANVRTLFASRCSGYCHAGGTGTAASLVLAPEDGGVPSLVDRPSRQVPRLMLVAAGDPENSYLVRKVEGTMAALPECAGAMNHLCGIPMPYAYVNEHPAVTLPAAQIEMIRRWIRDGAQVPAD